MRQAARYKSNRMGAIRPSPAQLPRRDLVHPAQGNALGTKASRRGITLIEMLIVVSIVMILLVITLRAMPTGQDRRLREAAREVNVYLSSARNLAMELGRPCGVIFKRAQNTNFSTASTLLEQYMVPPPYAGDVTDAVVQVQNQSVVGSGTITLLIRIRPNDFSDNLIYPGDGIQLNNQGPYYTLSSDFPQNPPDNGYYIFSAGIDSDGDGFIDSNYLTATLDLQSTTMQNVPWPTAPNWSQPVPFQILRSIDKVPVSTMQLPAGTAVDLDFSGPGNATFPTEWTTTPKLDNSDVGIVFSGNGAVEGMRCYRFNTSTGQYEYGGWRTAWPVYLLVGSSSRVRDFAHNPLPAANPNRDELPNWADLSSFWITINHLTGLVATSENSAVNYTSPAGFSWADVTTWLPFINQSRTIAREQQSMGGR